MGRLSALCGLNAPPSIACRVKTWGNDAPCSEPESARGDRPTKYQSRELELRRQPWISVSPVKFWAGGVCVSFHISLTHFLLSLYYCKMKENKISTAEHKTITEDPEENTGERWSTNSLCSSLFVVVFYIWIEGWCDKLVFVVSLWILLARANENNGLICVNRNSMWQFFRMVSVVIWSVFSPQKGQKLFQCCPYFPYLYSITHRTGCLSSFCFQEPI